MSTLKNEKIQEIITRILTKGEFDSGDLNRLYRFLSKQTHPDLTGKDGESFIRVREAYLKARAKLENFKTARFKGDFDFNRILREEGFHGSYPPRFCLYIALNRYFTLGLYNRKLRDSSPLLKRNELIINTVIYWADRYDADFSALFRQFNLKRFYALSTTREMRNYYNGKRMFLEGATGFFNYQKTGRVTTAKVARDKFTLAASVLSLCTSPDNPISVMALWFRNELEKEPALTGLV
ncbi:MAG: hypothetical protein DRP87_15375 [Spirochaetes bacterium]|nr:MAG: hypothetical protein DRP87_15375 [Spirochaetota bacterium]